MNSEIIIISIPVITILFFAGILYYVSGFQLEQKEHIQPKPKDTDLRKRLDAKFRVKFGITGDDYFNNLSINSLIEFKENFSNMISGLTKRISEEEDNANCEFYEHDKELPAWLLDNELEESKEIVSLMQDYFKSIDNILNQKQYDIFYYLNCDPSIASEAKLYDQIDFIKKIPPNELGHDGVVFTLHGKSYSVRKIDHYFQSDSIREYEESLIQL